MSILDQSLLIRELRVTLGRMERALEVISDAIVITDAEGLVLWCNEPFCRQTKVGSRLEVLGQPILPLLKRTIDPEGKLPKDLIEQARRLEGQMLLRQSSEPLQVVQLEWSPVRTELPHPLVFVSRNVSPLLAGNPVPV
ncbi:MAG: PAS domain-containing protein [Prochlorococcaceae cyanobacterium]|jgi:PAS domain-containing protein